MDTVSQEPPSVRAVSNAIANATDLPPPSRSVPYGVALVAAIVLDAVYKLVGSKTPPPVTPFVVRLMKLNVIYDASKATRLLGWTPHMKPLDGVAKFARLLNTET
jgi:nucleoside-diphosphate-sugar epimerase